MRENPSPMNRQLSMRSPGLRDRKLDAQTSVLNVPAIDNSVIRLNATHLSENENNTLKIKGNKYVSFLSLFKYATLCEWAMMVLGIITSSVAGCLMPLEVVLYGEFTSLLLYRKSEEIVYDDTLVIQLFGGGRRLNETTPQEEKNIALIEDSIAFGLACITVALVQFFMAIWGIDIFNYTARKQITRIRRMYLDSVLRQEMAWFDTNVSDNFASGVSENLEKMKDGMGEKVSMFTVMLMSFVASLIVSLIYGWKLTLFVLFCTPIIVVSAMLVAKVQSALTAKELKAYGAAGHIAEEVLNSVRTVISFGGEEKEVKRYSQLLEPAERLGVRRGLVSGLGNGVIWLIIYINYAISFWYGISLILDDRYNPNPEYTPAVMIIVLFGVLAGAEQLGLTAPLLETFAAASGSAVSIFNTIDRKSQIDSLSDEGIIPETATCLIEFEKAHFHYPSRPDIPVLQDLNLKIFIGETVALVGASGCGKSTCIQLIQRLYDPTSGAIMFDGQPINTLNLKWLRSQIGIVGQEPALFSLTVEENIRYGNPQASSSEIENAAKAAYCHDFIQKLPDGYRTMVGERGAQLSGGQKQRIAIARALVRNPKILLLDEATSALDLQSEAKVQKALERAAKGRTTIIVAHRLSTIKCADRIVYLEAGKVTEMGTHDELMIQKGKYHSLVMAEGSDPAKSIVPQSAKLTLTDEKKFDRNIRHSAGDEDDDDSPNINLTNVTKEEKNKKAKQVFLCSLLRYNKPEWRILVIATLSASLVGASFPVFAIIFGEFYGLLSDPDEEFIRREIVVYSAWFLVVGLITALATFLQTYFFIKANAALTKRLRIASLAAMLRQEVAWFDRKINSVGALTSRLATDCTNVQGAAGIRLGAMVQAVSTLVLAITLSLYYTWKMTLVSLTSVPIVLGAIILEGRIVDAESTKERMAMEASTKIATEAIVNIRTVAGLCAERTVMDHYNEVIVKANKSARSRTRFRGIVYALSTAVPFAGYALSLYYGGVLAANDEVHYKNVIKVSEALIFGAWMMGQALAFTPNLHAAILSARKIFHLLERQPAVLSPVEVKSVPDIRATGEVSYHAVKFTYPTRPEARVLKNLFLDIPTGKTIALVGQSGCGKSTCIQLLQRFYDVDGGNITLDKMQINGDYMLPALRSQLGIVSQEPVLFDKTIADNIAYGDNTREVPMTEIIQTAKVANIHNFILSLPEGYETNLGTKGTQLSGGQKQRIAIARALVRNPRVLLLDEATSALDMESEKVVSEALEKARCGRTCIIVAHRLASVSRADLIAVVADGKIAELGAPEKLLGSGGLYAQLYALQERASI